MNARGRDEIVNMSSVQSLFARAAAAPCAAAEGGPRMLTRGMCADLAPHGTQVNTIAPGRFAAELTRELVEDPKFWARVSARTPGGSVGETSTSSGVPRSCWQPRRQPRQRSCPVRRRGMTAVL